MPAVARLGDLITGMTDGEHNGHYPPHGACTLTGSITGSCSSFVFIENIPVAIVGSVTTEQDCCDSGRHGTVTQGSAFVFVEGMPLSRVADAISPHNGTASISTGSDFVFSE